ncbi:DUF5133 domain-containing protein [Streptomyces sp. W1SF4]|uniref:DUF5133 domain-containing protein n=1 Tax=Streptomyces sp. W1SF4 TaxID=2305220 RepID=UPI001F49DEA0|nr:DUF5133 domain-containing protein [Streptomyces sp. W1SF4]
MAGDDVIRAQRLPVHVSTEVAATRASAFMRLASCGGMEAGVRARRFSAPIVSSPRRRGKPWAASKPAARLTGTAAAAVAEAVFALHAGAAPVEPGLERALAQTIDRARTSPTEPDAGASRLMPNALVLRQHLNHLRAVRRRLLASPEDPATRADLGNAAYTLCVLIGQRSTHAALQAAEQYLAARRMTPGAAPKP